MGVRVVSDSGGPRASMLAHAEEDVDVCSNRAGCCRLRSEVRHGFHSYCILLIVHSKDDLGCLLEVFDWGVGWEESILSEEEKVQEGPELGCLAVTGEFGVFAQPEAEVEAQLVQVGGMTGFSVGGGVRRGHDGFENAKEGGLFLFDRRVLDAVGFKLLGETSVQSGVGLGVWRLSWVGEAIQEVGFHNFPPYLRKRLFPKLIKALFGVDMKITCSPLPQNNGNLPLPFFGGNYPIVLLENIY